MLVGMTNSDDWQIPFAKHSDSQLARSICYLIHWCKRRLPGNWLG